MPNLPLRKTKSTHEPLSEAKGTRGKEGVATALGGGRLVRLSIGLAALFWIVDPIVDALLQGEGSQVGQFLAPSPAELWIRSFVTFVLLAFGAYAQRTFSKGQRTEQALRQSEQRYRRLVEVSPDAILVHSGGRVAFINEAAARLLGAATPEQLLGQRVIGFVHPDYREQAKARIRRICKADKDPSLLQGPRERVLGRMKLVRLDGRVVDVEVAATIATYDGRAAAQMVIRDIGERQQTEERLRESEQKYRDLVENISEVIYSVDKNGVVTYVSPVVESIGGFTPSEVIGHSIAEFIHPDDLPPLLESFQRTISGNLEPSEYRVPTKSGELRWVRSSSRPILEGDEIVGLRAVLMDITDRKRAEEALRESEARYRSLVETSPDAITLTDPDGTIIMVNRQAVALHGYDRAEEMIGRSALDFIDPEDRARALENLRKTAESGSVKNLEYTLLRKNGTPFPAELSASLIVDSEGNPAAFIGVVRDITERKRFERQLVDLAVHDPLTGLFNRRRFQEELERELAQAQRYGTQGAVLFVDLDQFKDINDSLGHRAGDELLARVADLLSQRLRETDIVARPGGDEFAVLLPRSNLDQAQVVADQLLDSVRRHAFMVSGQPFSITASAGIALFPEHGTTAGELLSRADLAMYQAKENGRNRSAVYAVDIDWQTQIESRLDWQNRIREALEKELFLVHAQPILDLRTNEVSQCELLLRLKNGDGEIVPAGSFIDIAERFGLIQAIDRWVVQRAIHLIAEHNGADGGLRLEVNLSSKAFGDRELLPIIRRELAATSIDPSNLILEVTETAAIANLSEAQKFVATLKELGCRFAIDDFGVGFSSFYHLKHLPVDYLKIDGSFIRDLPRSTVDQHIVKSMVGVARGLGKETIAEFVGDEETVRLLREYGVDYAQGHHIGRPGDVAEMLSATARRRGRAA